MKDARQVAEFVDFVTRNEIVQYGQFTLSSERVSPYFFNSGNFDTGSKIHTLSEAFAITIHESNLRFDSLYGPSYKGIPLCVATSIALDRMGWDYGYSFNSKQTTGSRNWEGYKVGGKRVVILDDVITSGTSIHKSIEAVEADNGRVVGIVVILDREEVGIDSDMSAVQKIKERYGIPVLSILTARDLAIYCPMKYKAQIDAYMAQYGVK